MRILTLRCGVGDMPLLPGRRDLAFLDDVAKQVLPHDDNPTPDEIAKGKEVPHLGAPQGIQVVQGAGAIFRQPQGVFLGQPGIHLGSRCG